MCGQPFSFAVLISCHISRAISKSSGCAKRLIADDAAQMLRRFVVILAEHMDGARQIGRHRVGHFVHRIVFLVEGQIEQLRRLVHRLALFLRIAVVAVNPSLNQIKSGATSR